MRRGASPGVVANKMFNDASCSTSPRESCDDGGPLDVEEHSAEAPDLLMSLQSVHSSGLAITTDDLSRSSVGRSTSGHCCNTLPQVLPGVHIGARRDASDLESVTDRGIRAFLCVACNVPQPFPTFAEGDSSMRCHIPMEDSAGTCLPQVLEQVFDFADEARRRHFPLVVYCERGISRSAACVIALIMRREGASFDDALRKLREVYPRADPNFAFVDQLRSLGSLQDV